MANALTGITYPDEGGRYATFGYTGSMGAASFSEHAGGVERTDIVELAQTNGERRNVTNVHGKKTTYIYSDIAGLPRATSIQGQAHGTCVAANRSYTYDSEGHYDKVTDWEGNQTDYDFDAEGRLQSVTTGYGTSEARTATYEWDVIWDKVTKVATPLLETEFDLGGFGRIERITMTNKAPYGVPNQVREWNIAYTPYPDSALLQTISVDGPRTDVDDHVTYSFDTNGLLASVSEKVSGSLNLVTTVDSRDEYRRPTKITFPSGMQREIAYHPRGYVLQMKDTVGTASNDIRTTDFTYAGNGDLRRVDLPDGSTLRSSTMRPAVSPTLRTTAATR